MGFTTPSNYSTADATVRLLGAGAAGFEPAIPGPKPGALPLGYAPTRTSSLALRFRGTARNAAIIPKLLAPVMHAGQNRHLTEALPHGPPVRKPPRRAPAAHPSRLAPPLRSRRCRKLPYRFRSSRPPKRPRAVALLPVAVPQARDS